MVQNDQAAQHRGGDGFRHSSGMVVALRKALSKDPRADTIIDLLDHEHHVN